LPLVALYPARREPVPVKTRSLRSRLTAANLRFARIDQPGDFLAVFVASAGEVDDEDLVLAHFGGDLAGVGEGVGGFQGGEDSFESRDLLEGFDGFGIGGADVFDSA